MPACSYEEFMHKLAQVPGIMATRGLYHLEGREAIVPARLAATPVIAKKMKIAAKAIRKIRWIPFIRAVFLCNTVAAGGASEESDIDVFIVVERERLWLTRMLVSVVLGIFRMRRTGTQVANKMCLSFYVTDDTLDLSHVSWGDPDIYLMYWIYQLIPIYDPDTLLHDIHALNTWTHTALPHARHPYGLHSIFRVDDTRLSRIVRRGIEAMWRTPYGAILERQAKEMQLHKMKKNTHSVQDADDTRVVINDTMLKFHENDRRARYRTQWQQRLASLSL